MSTIHIINLGDGGEPDRVKEINKKITDIAKRGRSVGNALQEIGILLDSYQRDGKDDVLAILLAFDALDSLKDAFAETIREDLRKMGLLGRDEEKCVCPTCKARN